MASRCDNCPRPAVKAYRFTYPGRGPLTWSADYAVCTQACAIELAKNESRNPFESPRFPEGSKLRELVGPDAKNVLLSREPPSVTDAE